MAEEARIAIILDQKAKLVADIKEFQDALKAANKELKKLGKQPIKIDTASLDKAQKELNETTAAAKKLTAEGKRLEREFTESLRKLEKASRSLGFDPLSKSAQNLRARVDEAGRALLKFGQDVPKALRPAAAETKKLEAATRRVRDEYFQFQKAGNLAAQAARKVAEAERSAAAAARNEAKALRTAATAARAHAKAQARAAEQARKLAAAQTRAAASAKGLLSSFRGLRAAIAAVGIGIAARRMAQFVKSAIDVKNAFDSVRNTLKAVTDSTAEYERAQDLVLATSRRLGLQIVSVGKNYAQLVAATKEVELTQGQVENVFLRVAEAGRVLNLSNQRIELTFLAISQIASKGILTLEELRRQLGDQIPGIVPAVAAAMGETTASFLSMVKAGDILAEQALPAIAKALKDLAGTEVQAASQTLAANIGRIQTSAQLAQKRIIELNDAALTPFLKRLDDIIATSPRTEAAVAAMVGDFIQLADELLRIAPAGIQVARILSGSLVVAFKTLTTVVKVLVLPLDRLFEALIRIKEFDFSKDAFDFEGVRIAAEETALAIGLVNEKLLEAQGKGSEEAIRIAEREAAERIDIVKRTAAQIEREETELGLNLEEISKRRAKFERALAQSTAADRKKILSDLLREEVRLELEAATDRAEAFDDIVNLARNASEERLNDSEAFGLKLKELETQIGEATSDALDRQLDKTRLNADQRLELQTDLAEKLREIAAETADKIGEVEEQLQEKLREEGANRKEAEQDASDAIVEIYENESKEKLATLGKFTEEAIKLEEKRVKAAEKAAKKLIELERKVAEERLKSQRDLEKALGEAGGLFPEVDTGDANTRIEKLKQLLASLTLDPLQTKDAQEELSELQRGVGRLGEGFDAMGASARAADLLLAQIDTEGFRSQIAGLTAANRTFIETQIRGFADAARLGNANSQLVRQLAGDFQTVGLTAAAAFQGLTGDAAAVSATVDDISAALDRLGEGSSATRALEDLRAKTVELAGGAKEAAEPLKEVAAASGEIAEKAPAAAAGMDQLGTTLAENEGAITAAGASLKTVGDALPIIQDAVADLASTLPAILDRLKVAVDNETLGLIATDVAAIVASAEKSKEGMEALVAGLEAILAAAEKTDEIKGLAEDGIGALAKEELIEGVKKLAVQLDAAAVSIASVVTEAGNLETGVSDAEKSMKSLTDFIEQTFLPSLADLRTGLDETETKIGELIAKLAELDTALDTTIKKENALGEATRSTTKDIRDQVTAIDELIAKLNELEQRDADVID